PGKVPSKLDQAAPICRSKPRNGILAPSARKVSTELVGECKQCQRKRLLRNPFWPGKAQLPIDPTGEVRPRPISTVPVRSCEPFSPLLLSEELLEQLLGQPGPFLG